MDSKFYFLATICLIGGLVGGYLVASTTLQNQLVVYELRLQSKDAELQSKVTELQSKDTQLQAKDTQLQQQNALIQSQDNLLQQLKANMTKLQERIQQLESQLPPGSTQVMIDSASWPSRTSFTLDVRNTGSVDALIESVSIRLNQAGSPATIIASASVTKAILVGSHATLGPASYSWFASTSYMIRVTTNNGFYYEAVFTTPSS